MRYFNEILDYFNSLNNRKVLLSEVKGRMSSKEGPATVYTWTTGDTKKGNQIVKGHATVRFGSFTYDLRNDQTELKNKLLSAGFSQKLTDQILSGSLSAGATFKQPKAITADQQAGQDQQKPDTPQDTVAPVAITQTPEELAKQQQLMQLQLELDQRMQEFEASYGQLANENSLAALTEDQLNKLKSDAQTLLGLGTKQPTQQQLLETFLRTRVTGKNSFRSRLEVANYFDPIQDADIPIEQKIEAKLAVLDTLNKISSFVSKYQGIEISAEDYPEYEKEARELYSKIKINNPTLGDDRRKIIIYSDDGQYAGAFGDRGTVNALVTLLKDRLKSAFKTIEDPQAQKFELQKTEKIEDVISNQLGKAFESLVHSTVNLQALIRKRDAACNLKAEECAEFEKIVKEQFETYKQILVTNRSYFEGLVKFYNEDTIGKSKDIEAMLELAEEFLDIVEDKKLTQTFQTLTSLLANNPLFNNASNSMMVGNVVGLGRKADIRLIYDTEEAAQRAYQYSGQKYIKLEDGTFAIDVSLKVSISEKGELKLSTTGFGNAVEVCYSLGGKREKGQGKGNIREADTEAREQFERTLGSLFGKSIDGSIELDQQSDDIKKRMSAAFLKTAEVKDAMLTIAQSSEAQPVDRGSKKAVIENSTEVVAKSLKNIARSLGIDALGDRMIKALFRGDGTVDSEELRNLRDEIKRLNIGDKESSDILIDFMSQLARTKKGKNEEEFARKRNGLMVDILGTLEGISLQKRLKSNDPKKVIEAQDRIIADVLIHAAASTEDISILALNLGEGKLSKLSHNEMLLRLSQMLRTGEAQYVLTESGYSIKYRDNKKQEQIIRFKRNTTRQGVTGTVTVNRATKEASAQKESKDYNKKLELLEQIIQTQRQLLLKLIDEPKIISSD